MKVASLSELEKGASKTVQPSGKAVALLNVDGTMYALDNTCPHRGGPLGEGTLEGGIVTCAWHMWQYSVRTGEHLTNNSIKVAAHPLQAAGNGIKVVV